GTQRYIFFKKHNNIHVKKRIISDVPIPNQLSRVIISIILTIETRSGIAVYRGRGYSLKEKVYIDSKLFCTFVDNLGITVQPIQSAHAKFRTKRTGNHTPA